MNWVDTISLMAWVAGGAIGLASGFLKIWIPFMFLLAGIGIAGALGIAIVPSLFGFLETGGAQEAAAFFVVFLVMQLFGAVIAGMLRHPLSVVSTMVSVFPMGALLNRGGGFLAGLLYGCIFVSVFLIGLQQWPVDGVVRGLDESSFAHRPIGWIDRYVAAIEISP